MDMFMIQACQQMLTTNRWEWIDITIDCHLDTERVFRMWEDLPKPSSFIHFSGELTKCKQQIVGGNMRTTCISILLN